MELRRNVLNMRTWNTLPNFKWSMSQSSFKSSTSSVHELFLAKVCEQQTRHIAVKTLFQVMGFSFFTFNLLISHYS